MTTKIVKRLPYGTSNFEKLISENYAYVDKTQFIEQLENEANPYQFFIRPRKFGKSLLLSMLSHYYDINRAGKFESLFGDLYIGKHPTPHKNGYGIIEFNFSGLNTYSEEDFKASFSRNVQDAIIRFISRYRNLFPQAEELIQKIDQEGWGIDALRIAYNAARAAGIKIFVLIDEYDHFANDLIAMGNQMGDDVYRRMVRANGLVRDFYETLKIGTADVLDRIFITGISPIMLDDLTSGFNMAAILTLDLAYNEMMGFTRKEVDALMVETGVNPDHINVDMELYYNGYLFHKEGENRVYNPSMILFFFNQILKEGKAPENIIDDNLKTDYGRLQRLFLNDENREKLLEITKENSIASEILRKFSIDNMENDKYFISLLFYMGLLTIDKFEAGRTYLKIPNYSIQTVYWEYIEELTRDLNKEIRFDSSAQKTSVWELAYKGNPHPFIEFISQNIFSRLSNRDLIRFDEKYIKIMLLNGLFQSNYYIPTTEREVENGYIDIYLQRNPSQPDVKYEWVWELKYLKKADRRELHAKRKEARAALEKYRESRQFGERPGLKYAALIFIGKDRYEIMEL
ncbi:MAG: ATP-binding protein [Tannerellaceae bacterium]|jgi:hypothetical protein|nr:ATP-binding protein [Tannerellaceae bacterium]